MAIHSLTVLHYFSHEHFVHLSWVSVSKHNPLNSASERGAKEGLVHFVHVALLHKTGLAVGPRVLLFILGIENRSQLGPERPIVDVVQHKSSIATLKSLFADPEALQTPQMSDEV